MDETNPERFRILINARLAEVRENIALGHEGQAVVELYQQSVGRLSRMEALQHQAMAKATHMRRDIENRHVRRL